MQTKFMSVEKAEAIDKSHPILLGGIGEHDFIIGDAMSTTQQRLFQGGCDCGWVTEFGTSNEGPYILLHVDVGSFKLQYDKEEFKLKEIFQKIEDSWALVWHHEHQRFVIRGMQYENTAEPLLAEYQPQD
jgi:hypothetical protein